jgi:transcriptional regulator with XRE-family HTH domain
MPRNRISPPPQRPLTVQVGGVTRAEQLAEFSARIRRLTADKGWTQAELARRSNTGRESISRYFAGKMLPDNTTLYRIVDALMCKPEDLWPWFKTGNANPDMPEFEIRAIVGDPHRTWLRINRPVRNLTAAKIHVLISEDDAQDRAG